MRIIIIQVVVQGYWTFSFYCYYYIWADPFLGLLQVYSLYRRNNDISFFFDSSSSNNKKFVSNIVIRPNHLKGFFWCTVCMEMSSGISFSPRFYIYIYIYIYIINKRKKKRKKSQIHWSDQLFYSNMGNT